MGAVFIVLMLGAFNVHIQYGIGILVLGLLIYAVIYTALNYQVVRPIHELYLKCYAVTRSDLVPPRLAAGARLSGPAIVEEMGLNFGRDVDKYLKDGNE